MNSSNSSSAPQLFDAFGAPLLLLALFPMMIFAALAGPLSQPAPTPPAAIAQAAPNPPSAKLELSSLPRDAAGRVAIAAR